MKCYKHHEVESVGICSNCSKGICTECAVDMGKLACKNSCEEEVKALIELTTKAKKSYKRTAITYYGLAIFMGLSGGLFIYIGIKSKQQGEQNFVSPLGVIFLIGMCFTLYTAIKYNKKNKCTTNCF